MNFCLLKSINIVVLDFYNCLWYNNYVYKYKMLF